MFSYPVLCLNLPEAIFPFSPPIFPLTHGARPPLPTQGFPPGEGARPVPAPSPPRVAGTRGTPLRTRSDPGSPPPAFRARRDAEAPGLDPLLRVVRMYGRPENRGGQVFLLLLLQDPQGSRRIHDRSLQPQAAPPGPPPDRRLVANNKPLPRKSSHLTGSWRARARLRPRPPLFACQPGVFILER